MEVERDNGALIRRQARKGRAQHQQVVALWCSVISWLDPADLRSPRDDPAEQASLAARRPARGTDDDAIEPGSKASGIAKCLPPSPRELQPSLDGIRGVAAVTTDEPRQSEQPVVMLGHERGKLGRGIYRSPGGSTRQCRRGHADRFRRSGTPHRRIILHDRVAISGFTIDKSPKAGETGQSRFSTSGVPISGSPGLPVAARGGRSLAPGVGDHVQGGEVPAEKADAGGLRARIGAVAAPEG